MIIHDTASEALILQRDGSLVRFRLGEAASFEHPEQLKALPSRTPDEAQLVVSSQLHKGQLVLGADADALELWRWDAQAPLSRAAKIKLGRSLAGWAHIAVASQGDWLVAIDEDGLMSWLDLVRGKRLSLRVEGSPRALHVSPSGRWVALACAHHKCGFVRIWSIDDQGQPELHMSAVDRRALDVRTRQLVRGQVALAYSPDETVLCVYESAHPAPGTLRDDGWRATLWAIELEPARRLWSSAIDYECTGDLRGVEVLYPEYLEGCPGALLTSAKAPFRLWCGSGAGSLLCFDWRDGALLSAQHLGTSAALVALGQPAQGDDDVIWAISEHGKILRTP